MERKSDRKIGLALILIMAASAIGVFAVKPASAQTIPAPSVPTFTVQSILNTSYVSPAYTINPYTGKNETTSYGYQTSTQMAEFTIKNQPFVTYTDSSGNQIELYYGFRFKGHLETTWNITLL